MLGPIIVVDSETLNGTPCFRGTRVPFKNLSDYLEGGKSLDEFLRQFPTVTREMAIRALEEAKESDLEQIVPDYEQAERELELLALEGLHSGGAVVGDDAFWDAKIQRAKDRAARAR